MADDNLDWILDDLSPDLDPANAKPVTVLTGFLGAGKTTLVNRILAEEHGLRIAVLVNDFGEIDIDSELIVGVESGTVSLANGCVCCEVRDDLISAIDSVLRADDSLDAIVLEASGVAEPMGIARTFTSPAYRGRIRLDGIVAVVDAEQLPAQTEDPASRDLVYGQIGFSDLVILNKIDLADRARIDEVRDFVLSRMPAVRIIETERAAVPYEILVGSGSFDPDDLRWSQSHEHDHDVGFVSWVYRRDGPFESAAVESAIKRLPRSVYRIKGFLNAADDPDHRMLLQAVGMRGEVVPFDEWGDRQRTTALVIIADGQQVDRAEVETILDACLVQ
jgi:G3E family GTPase